MTPDKDVTMSEGRPEGGIRASLSRSPAMVVASQRFPRKKRVEAPKEPTEEAAPKNGIDSGIVELYPWLNDANVEESYLRKTAIA